MEKDAQAGKLRLAFKIGIVLLTIVICQCVVLFWFFLKPPSAAAPPTGSYIFQLSPLENVVQKAFPQVDFTRIYPDLTPAEIDQLQRECFSVRYVYEPFVEFRPVATAKRFVNITAAGYRMGAREQPWPPRNQDRVVFVFGGSTTFSYGLADAETLVVALEKELSRLWPGETVHCYNFGRGYYFSTQERMLFQMLLASGHVPDLAIFIDGLNDFYFPNGQPALTATLYNYTAPDLPLAAPSSSRDADVAVAKVIARYANNVRMTAAIAKAYNVTVIFVGQPVPFFNLPRTPDVYPFPGTFAGHELCRIGYDRFEQTGLKGAFGDRFLWCGDAFSQATTIMYADSIHYSHAGAEALAKCIVSRGGERGLLPAVRK